LKYCNYCVNFDKINAIFTDVDILFVAKVERTVKAKEKVENLKNKVMCPGKVL
jgi:hypothetical protein